MSLEDGGYSLKWWLIMYNLVMPDVATPSAEDEDNDDGDVQFILFTSIIRSSEAS